MPSTLVTRRGGDAIIDGRPDHARQIGLLFGVSHSAARRVIDTLGPLLALAPVPRRRANHVAIVDGTLILTRDHRIAAPSKKLRHTTDLQVAIDAN